jgi:hypothetical protein
MSGAEPRRIEILDLLAPERVLVGPVAADKNRVLSEIARIAAADTGIAAPVILAALAERERLGSTGVGGGIAMPHAELRGCAASAAISSGSTARSISMRSTAPRSTCFSRSSSRPPRPTASPPFPAPRAACARPV